MSYSVLRTTFFWVALVVAAIAFIVFALMLEGCAPCNCNLASARHSLTDDPVIKARAHARVEQWKRDGVK